MSAISLAKLSPHSNGESQKICGLVRLLLFMCMASLAHAGADPEGLPINGEFLPKARVEVPKTKMVELMVETHEGQMPTGWSVNPAYPGEAVIVGSSGDQSNAVQLIQTETKPVGIWYYKNFPVEADSYRLKFEYRGTGQVWGALTLYINKKFRTSLFTKRFKPESTESWSTVEKEFSLKDMNISSVKVALFCYGGPVDIRNVTVTPIASGSSYSDDQASLEPQPERSTEAVLDAPGEKPSVLFLSLKMPMADGGAAMRKNIERLDGLGYRVAYASFFDLEDLPEDYMLQFDVLVLLQQPNRVESSDEFINNTEAFHQGLHDALAQGAGILVFPSEMDIRGAKAFWDVVHPYGAYPLSGTLMDKSPVLSSFGYAWYAYTTQIRGSPITQGVEGLWYPVAGPDAQVHRYNLGTMRHPNTVPFNFDDSWTSLVEVGPGTTYTPIRYESPWVLDAKFHTPPEPLSIFAVRDGLVDGKGRMAICGINSVFSDFIAGNGVYNGVCTGKGLKGKPSDLNILLMNALGWLGAPSVEAGRQTIAASLSETYALEKFKYPEPLRNPMLRPLEKVTEQFIGLIGARSTLSGGSSTVSEYATTARKLGMDYLVFLEDYENLSDEDFEKLKQECAEHSDADLLLLPGIRAKDVLGVNFFGFKEGLTLPEPQNLKEGTKLLRTHITDGHHIWATNNGGRTGMACGNYRLAGEETSGMPATDFKSHNPFISLYTYKDGELTDRMMDVYLECAARTEWVSPITINLMDSAEALEKAWNSDEFKTVWLRNAGSTLEGMKERLGERTDYYEPTTYVTNGPVIDEWRSTGIDFNGGHWDWTRYRIAARLAVSSDKGLKEIKVMDGMREIQRFLPQGAESFEYTMQLNHNDMHNLILVVTDNAGRQAISDEIWTKNQLLQLTWCQDRNNMLGSSITPAPLSPTGSTMGNYAVPFSMEKCGFRESLVPPINQDLSRLSGYDGQPYGAADVSPAPVIRSIDHIEGGIAISRNIGRLLSSPDAAVQFAEATITQSPEVERPAPGRPGPMIPLSLFNAEMTYTTFIHPGHLSTPVILEGTITIIKDTTFADDVTMGISVMEMSFPLDDEYERIAVRHAETGEVDEPLNLVTRIEGDLNEGAYLLAYPSYFGAVGIYSLVDGLEFAVRGRKVFVGYRMAGETLKAGTELKYRAIVFASGRAATFPPKEEAEQFYQQLGLSVSGSTSYTVKPSLGKIANQEYVLSVDGQGVGFSGEILLPENFPCVLPILVENLNPRWSSVAYDSKREAMRPLGMVADKAYCHRLPTERDGKLFVGHPFTSDNSELIMNTVQVGEREVVLQINNPTDSAITALIKRTPDFDFIECEDMTIELPAGQIVEKVLR
ncbi:hypothetical protein [Cerasicoccus frondis]|uniref:hypothetical protein n=1 Tax=Cerasicoccus frondis TaxID=490090 RepID=UPI00285286DE|nr:hypothetical protein [Cerasicoccus frondis]